MEEINDKNSPLGVGQRNFNGLWLVTWRLPAVLVHSPSSTYPGQLDSASIIAKRSIPYNLTVGKSAA